jgi:hypothetical protein
VCNKLEESGNPILDNQKKALLIANIKDSDYSAVCDMCADKDFMTTKAMLHDKAIKLNKQSQGQRSSRKHNKMSMNNYAKPGGKSNTNPSNNGNQSKESDGFRLSNDAWNLLSSDNKRLWTEMRNAKRGSSSKRGGTPKYAKQYDNRKANLAKSANGGLGAKPNVRNDPKTVTNVDPTVSTSKNDSKSIVAPKTDNDIGNIWKPQTQVRRVNLMMKNRNYNKSPVQSKQKLQKKRNIEEFHGPKVHGPMKGPTKRKAFIPRKCPRATKFTSQNNATRKGAARNRYQAKVSQTNHVIPDKRGERKPPCTILSVKTLSKHSPRRGYELLINFNTGAIWSIAIEIAFNHFPKALINFGRKSSKHGRKSVDEWIHYYAKENTRNRLLYNAMNEARKREYRKEDHDYFQEIKLQLRHMCINKRRKIHETDGDSDKSKARVSENIFIYSKPDVRVSFIRYFQDSHNYRIGYSKKS